MRETLDESGDRAIATSHSRHVSTTGAPPHSNHSRCFHTPLWSRTLTPQYRRRLEKSKMSGSGISSYSSVDTCICTYVYVCGSTVRAQRHLCTGTRKTAAVFRCDICACNCHETDGSSRVSGQIPSRESSVSSTRSRKRPRNSASSTRNRKRPRNTSASPTEIAEMRLWGVGTQICQGASRSSNFSGSDRQLLCSQLIPSKAQSLSSSLQHPRTLGRGRRASDR